MHLLKRAVLSLALIAVTAAPGLAQSGSFGAASVVVGDELIVAEPNNNFRSGLVYVYRRTGDGWRESAQLRAPDAKRADGFGTALAVSGNTLFIGQRGGRLHTYRKQGQIWRSSGELRLPEASIVDRGCDHYGYCTTDFGVTLAADGDWLLVGLRGRAPERGDAREEATAGAVVVFQRGPDGAWLERGRLAPSDGAPGDGFGASIALAGGQALVGAPGRSAVADAAVEGAGRVYLFGLENGDWREMGTLEGPGENNAGFGTSIALRGNVAVIGAPGSGGGAGAAFVYRRGSARDGWSEAARLTAPDGNGGDRLGSAVALAGDDVWVGAPAPRGTATGMAFVFRGRAGAAPTADAPTRFHLAETVTRDAFGDRITAGAGVAAITATGMHHQAGAVYVYERDGRSGWRQSAQLISPPDALEPLLGKERACTDGKIGPFHCEKVDLLAFVPNSMLRAPEHARGVRTNDNWGWTDPETGREYALVGRNDGTSFVDVTDPSNPVLIGDLPKTPDTPPSQLWRDIKVYQDHAFIVADGAGNHGMQVFDLRRLRDVVRPPALFAPDVHYPRVASVHNIAINEETGFAYLVGSRGGGETCGGGLHMVDVREPLNPRFVGCYQDERGTHDVQCIVYRGPDSRYQGREICLKANADVFAISDVTDKASPRFVARASHPNPAYMHQGWVTEDHRYYLMNDESDVIAGNVPTTRTLIWDLSDLEDPLLVEQFMGSLPASAHNLYVRDNLMYQANYRYGLHVLDVSDPRNPKEVGSFDTTPYLSGPGFSGAWSNYPFFKSGTIVVTSLQEGLFLLKKRD